MTNFLFHESLLLLPWGLLKQMHLLGSNSTENHGHFLTGSDCSTVLLISLDLLLWLEQDIFTKDSIAFCRERYNGIWFETVLTWCWRENTFHDLLSMRLVPSVSLPVLSWLFGFWLSHVVGIPIRGNGLWDALTLPLKSNCGVCKSNLGSDRIDLDIPH